MLRKDIQIQNAELKFDSEGGFSGYASVFGGVDSYNDTIVRGAYTDIIERVERGDSRMPKMFVNHKSWDIPVGKWLKMQEDTRGLYVEGELTKGNPQAQVIRAAMQHETVDGLSIGFMIGDYEIIDNEGESMRVIKSIKELPEISVVTYPADDAARVDLSSVKSTLDEIKTIREFEEFLREVAGFSNGLANATASKAKRLFATGEPGAKEELPKELVEQFTALTLFNTSILKG